MSLPAEKKANLTLNKMEISLLNAFSTVYFHSRAKAHWLPVIFYEVLQ